jgi:hypothetical protein
LCIGRREVGGTGIAQQSSPLVDCVGRAAMNLEPGKSLPKNAAVKERASSPRARREVTQPALKSKQLAKPLQVTACQWKAPESSAVGKTLLGLTRPAVGAVPSMGPWPVSLLEPALTRGKAERHEQTA